MRFLSSTFKVLTAAIAIDAGCASPSWTVTAATRETFPNRATVRDPFVHPVNNYTLAGVLIDSSNVGISKFGDLVSAQTRYEYLKKFGVSTGSAIDFGGKVSGDIRPVDQWDTKTDSNTKFEIGQAASRNRVRQQWLLWGGHGSIQNTKRAAQKQKN